MKVPFLCVFLLATMVETLSSKVLTGRDRYIVMLKDGATDEHIESLVRMVEEHEGAPRGELFIKSTNSLLPMFYGNMQEETANKISMKDMVDLVEKDQFVSIDQPILGSNGVSNDNLNRSLYNTSTSRYNLDIIDDVNCTDGTFSPFRYGYLADIYILDSGINYDHVDFGWIDGYAVSRANFGYDVVDHETGSEQNGKDCNGHGTHVAGIAGGLYSGVAKEATLTSIRIYNCTGGGQISWVIDGINEAHKLHTKWSDPTKKYPFYGSVLHMSIQYSITPALDKVVNATVAKGMVAVTSSGNWDANACNISPGRAKLAINVGAHGYKKIGCKKPIYADSNFGPCVDIIAPGVNVLSASHTNNTEYVSYTGTSMAAPHVSGTVAIMKGKNKSLTPAQIKANIIANGIDDIDRSSMTRGDRAISDAKRLYITANLAP